MNNFKISKLVSNIIYSHDVHISYTYFAPPSAQILTLSLAAVYKKTFYFRLSGLLFTLIHRESDSQKFDDFSDMLIADLGLEFRTSEYLSAQT